LYNVEVDTLQYNLNDVINISDIVVRVMENLLN